MLFENPRAGCETLLLAGGGQRQMHMAAALAKKYAVYALGFERFGALPEGIRQAEELQGAADALILPLPVTKDGVFIDAPYGSRTLRLTEVLPSVRRGGTVLGGRMTETERREIERAGLIAGDYAADETFLLRNAVPTAEGAIAVAMQELPVILQGVRCLIIGGGRVSAALQTRLSALHAEVTVSARNPAELARAEGRGMHTLPLAALGSVIGTYTLVINTVPAQVLPAALLAKLREDALVIDLASKPGGDGFGEKQSMDRLPRKPEKCRIPQDILCCAMERHKA